MAIPHAFKGQTSALGVNYNPVQDMATLFGGNIDELTQTVITQQRLQAAHLFIRSVIVVKVKITMIHDISA